MFDAHTHLNDDALFPHRSEHIQTFIDAGGRGLVNVAVNAERAERGIYIARTALLQFPDTIVLSTVGIHPSEACFSEITQSNILDNITTIQKIYNNNSDVICAIGECGIDLHYPGAHETIQLQQELFAHQCEIARTYNLPVVIHSRDGYQETIDVLKNFPDLKIYFHCFGYGPDELIELQKTFPQIRFGFDGNITYPKAQNLRDALAVCERSKIVLETDAPYLAPIPLRGTTNEPANIKIIYEYVSQLLEWDSEDMAAQIEKNVGGLYSI